MRAHAGGGPRRGCLVGIAVMAVLSGVQLLPAGTLECSSENPTFGSSVPSSHVYVCQDTQGTTGGADDCYHYGVRPEPSTPVEGEYCRRR